VPTLADRGCHVVSATDVDVNEYKYLGSIVKGGGGTDEDLNCPIKMANATFVQLYRICRNKNIRMKTKLNIFNSNVKAVPTHTHSSSVPQTASVV
jgi:hypothetical protein